MTVAPDRVPTPPRGLAKLLAWVENPHIGSVVAVGAALAAAMFTALELVAPEPARRPSAFAFPAAALAVGAGTLVLAGLLAALLRVLAPGRRGEGESVDDDHA